MSSREDRPGGFRPEAEPSGASGGHLTPEAGSIYDPLTAPLPSEVEAERTRSAPRAADVIPRSEGRGRPVRRRVPVRRVRRTLRHIDPLSVMKLSFFYYGIGLVVWLVFVAIVFSILDSMGLFNSIEEVSEGFALGWQVNISLFFVEKWAFLIGLTLVVIGALVNLLLAFLYNVGADLVGGVEMTFAERDL